MDVIGETERADSGKSNAPLRTLGADAFEILVGPEEDLIPGFYFPGPLARQRRTEPVDLRLSQGLSPTARAIMGAP
jgi:hypothetical protein